MEIGTFDKRLLHPAPEFRFWHIGRQRMYIIDNFARDGQLIWWPGTDATLDQWDEACSDQFDLTDGILMQFTGLLDCNGNKVWEGDIVYNTFDQKDVEGGCFTRTVMSSSHGQASAWWQDWRALISTHSTVTGKCGIDDNPVEDPITNRVVGNIYQHLDLFGRDYYNPSGDLSTGIPPDTQDYDPESIYTFRPESSIGLIDEQSDLLPSDKYLMCTTIQPSLLPTNSFNRYTE